MGSSPAGSWSTSTATMPSFCLKVCKLITPALHVCLSLCFRCGVGMWWAIETVLDSNHGGRETNSTNFLHSTRSFIHSWIFSWPDLWCSISLRLVGFLGRESEDENKVKKKKIGYILGERIERREIDASKRKAENLKSIWESRDMMFRRHDTSAKNPLDWGNNSIEQILT